jgi:hypothetical protein
MTSNPLAPPLALAQEVPELPAPAGPRRPLTVWTLLRGAFWPWHFGVAAKARAWFTSQDAATRRSLP